ncbi:MAG: chromate reductase [Verrucomicrobiales bacterium]|jgi:chromate reductase
MEQTNLIAIVGSLRAGSVNRAVARAAIALAAEDVHISIHPIGDIPLYNGDVEERGLPESVVALNVAISNADGVIFFTPEYNSSLPAVTKNVIDWLSRAPRALDGVPFAAVATSPGGRAGASVLAHFEATFEHMRGDYRRYISLGIGNYGEKLDEAGELADPEMRKQLADWVDGFVSEL